MAVLNNGNLVSGSDSPDKTIKIWNPNTGAMINQLNPGYLASDLLVMKTGELISSHGKGNCKDGFLMSWNPNSGVLTHSIATNPPYNCSNNYLGLLNDNRLVTANYDGKLNIWP